MTWEGDARCKTFLEAVAVGVAASFGAVAILFVVAAVRCCA